MPYRRAHRDLVAASIYSIKLLTCSQISFYSHAESCFSLFLLSLVSKIYQFCTGTHVLRQYSLQYTCLQLGLITSDAWSSLLLPQNGVYVVHAYVHPSHHCMSSWCVAGAWRTWLLLLGISKILEGCYQVSSRLSFLQTKQVHFPHPVLTGQVHPSCSSLTTWELC